MDAKREGLKGKGLLALALLVFGIFVALPCYVVMRWQAVSDRPELFQFMGTDFDVLRQAGKQTLQGQSPYVPPGMPWTQFHPEQPYINYRYDIAIGELLGEIPESAVTFARVAMFLALGGAWLCASWLLIRSLALLGVQGASAYLPLFIASGTVIGPLNYANIEPLLPLLAAMMLWATLRERRLAWAVGLSLSVVMMTKAPQYAPLWLFPLLLDRRFFLRAVLYGLGAYCLVTLLSVAAVPHGLALYWDRYRFLLESFRMMPWSAFSTEVHALQEQSILQTMLNLFGPTPVALILFAAILALVIVNLGRVVVASRSSALSQHPEQALVLALLVALSVQLCLWQVEYAPLLPLVYAVVALLGKTRRSLAFFLLPYLFFHVLAILGIVLFTTPLLFASLCLSVILLTHVFWELRGASAAQPALTDATVSNYGRGLTVSETPSASGR